MALTKAFFEAVETGNVRRVRIMMKNSLLIDPSFAEFAEMEKAAASMDGLYDPHDERELSNDKSMWNDDYVDKLMVQVIGNFSHERIEHLKKVVRYLNPVKTTPEKAPKTPAEETHKNNNSSAPKSNHQQQKAGDQKNGTNLGTKVVVGAVAGAVVGGVVASVASATVVGGAVVGGVIGGAVTIAVNGGK